MKKRFNRANVLAEIRDRILYAREEYRQAAGRAHDDRNGWHQIPKGNDAAQRAYGKIWALTLLLAELEP